MNPLKKSSLLLIILLLPHLGYSQKERMKNLEFYDYHILHFGFSLGLNQSSFIVKRTPNFFLLDSVYSVEAIRQPGFNLGIVSDLRMGEYLNLRFIPQLSFANRIMEYNFVSGKRNFTVQKDVESTLLYFPLSVKYKSARHNNYRVYVLGGMNYSFDLASQKDAAENPEKYPIRLRRSDWLYEVGCGIDFYFQYFKFSPELKYSRGMNNMLVPSKNTYSNSLGGLNSSVFLISLLFE